MALSRSSKVYYIVLIAVGILGLKFAVFGFLAEAQRIQESQTYIYEWACYYPKSSAFSLGVVAAVSLSLARLIISAASPCLFSLDKYPKWKYAPLYCLFFSWIACIIGTSLFVAGAILDIHHRFKSGGNGFEINLDGSYKCYVVKLGFFGGGAAMSITSLFLGIVYYCLSFMASDVITHAEYKRYKILKTLYKNTRSTFKNIHHV